MDCIFCSIAQGKITSPLLYQDEQIIAFSDIQPQAPLHALIIPREHISTLNEVEPKHLTLVSRLFQTAQTLAKEFGYADEGYRLVMNCNAAGGQTVFHIHLHLLAGRQLMWPPG